MDATARPGSVGRPPGSTSGRTPRGGYPRLPAELGGFLAGFIEGDWPGFIAGFFTAEGSVGVRDVNGLLALVDLFDRHPLRGRKQREFQIWREAVAVHAEPGRPAGEYEPLSELREELKRERGYRPTAGLT